MQNLSSIFKSLRVPGVIFALTLFHPPAYAWKIGQPLIVLIQEAAQEGEKVVQKAGDAAADVVTLGEHGRRRDKERAEAAKKAAEIKAAAAKSARAHIVDSLLQKRQIYQESVVTAQRHLQDLDLAIHSVEKNLNYLRLITEQLELNRMNSDALTELIVIQQQDLAQVVRSLCSTNAHASELRQGVPLELCSALKIKITIYIKQVEEMPRAPMAAEDAEKLTGFSELSFETLSLLRAQRALAIKQLEEKHALVKSNEAKLADARKEN